MNQESHMEAHLITKFLQNEASGEEVKTLERWINENAENKQYFLDVQGLWASMEVDHILDEKRQDEDWKILMKKAGINDSQSPGLPVRGLNFKWITRIAAVFILGFVVSWAVFEGLIGKDPKNVSYNEISTPRGSNSQITLPDGSRVWLNAGSKIRYPQTFKGKSKEVYLEGEAYFEVESDKRNTFRVLTDEIVVQVHGTTFNVRSYPEDPIVETTLVEGEISIYKNTPQRRNKSEPIVLKPKQRIVLYKTDEHAVEKEPEESGTEDVPTSGRTKAKVLLSKNVNTERYTSWKDGELTIKSEPMAALAVQLERRYNVRIHFESEELKQLRYSGKIEDETIEQVLAAMKLASPITYRIKDRDIWMDLSEKKQADSN